MEIATTLTNAKYIGSLSYTC